MIFQGTVIGPDLWSIFFADAKVPIQKSGFDEIVFADDLNADLIVPRSMRTSTAYKRVDKCQSNLHRWGAANQTSFDPTKESRCIISRFKPDGAGCKLLGIKFDTALSMEETLVSLSHKLN